MLGLPERTERPRRTRGSRIVFPAASQRVLAPLPSPRQGDARLPVDSQVASSFFRISLTILGFALPPIAFITCPTKNPNSLSRPLRYSATLSGSSAITFAHAAAIAPSSETCASPSSATVASADLRDPHIAAKAVLAALREIFCASTIRSRAP